MKIGIDIDGVLADFNKSYKELIERESGLTLPPLSDDYPDTWYYERAAGVTREQEAKVWEEIKSTQFWGMLQPLNGAVTALQHLNAMRFAGHHIYFITARTGKMAKFYTEMWLMFHGMNLPTVLIADQKGGLVKGLQLDVFVDDRPENIEDVWRVSSKTRLYLINQPWNRGVALPGRVHRVPNIEAVLNLELPIVKKEAA